VVIRPVHGAVVHVSVSRCMSASGVKVEQLLGSDAREVRGSCGNLPKECARCRACNCSASGAGEQLEVIEMIVVRREALEFIGNEVIRKSFVNFAERSRCVEHGIPMPDR